MAETRTRGNTMKEQKMCTSQTLRVDKVFLDCDEAKTLERELILEYSDNIPNRLYLKLTSKHKVDGALNSYSIYEVEKLKRFINKIYLQMKENRDGDGSNL